MTANSTTYGRSRYDLPTLLYNALIAVLLPFEVLYIIVRMLVKGKSRHGFLERIGYLPDTIHRLGESEQPVIWVHAVSVGEVAAAQPIIAALHLTVPLAHIVVSTTTPTGRAFAQRVLPDIDALFYFPFDFPLVVERTMAAVNPALLMIMETELWPNVIASAKRRGCMTALVNGRISDHAFPQDRLVRPLYRWVLRNIDLICAQSQTDAQRLLDLGADPKRMHVTGNSKFDEAFPVVNVAEAAKLRSDFGIPDDAPVFVAGSTWPGEEEAVLKAFTDLRRDHHDLQLIIAPRHPERGDAIERLVHEHGYAAYRRSREVAREHPVEAVGQPASAELRVIILDTIGELARVYALAAIVFVGKSLTNRGGHNILQPMAQGKPVLIGPNMNNFRDIADIALREGSAARVHSAAELTETAGRLLASPEDLARMGERGPEAIEKYGGASARCAELLASLMESR
jgi:3-deoxy-D-manno-octulosonic-acid transferase